MVAMPKSPDQRRREGAWTRKQLPKHGPTAMVCQQGASSPCDIVPA